MMGPYFIYVFRNRVLRFYFSFGNFLRAEWKRTRIPIFCFIFTEKWTKAVFSFRYGRISPLFIYLFIYRVKSKENIVRAKLLILRQCKFAWSISKFRNVFILKFFLFQLRIFWTIFIFNFSMIGVKCTKHNHKNLTMH